MPSGRPKAKRLTAAAVAAAPAPAPAPALPPSKTVLMVDDDARLTMIVRDFLQLHGFTVVAAGTGEAGLEQLAVLTVDAVVLDVKMPGMGGLAALKQIRASYPDLPVVVLTQVDEEQVRDEALQLGASTYLTKPFHFEQLKAALQRF